MGKKKRILKHTVVKTSKPAILLTFGSTQSTATEIPVDILCSTHKASLTLKHLHFMQSKRKEKKKRS
jgi:hypothetical protein